MSPSYWLDIGSTACRKLTCEIRRRVRRGEGALGARAPPNLEKSSAQKCPKEEIKFRSDMSS